MTIDKDNALFAHVQPGKPGYFYTQECVGECIRRIARDGFGNLWVGKGDEGEMLAQAVLDVLGAVPDWDAYQRLKDSSQVRTDVGRAQAAEAMAGEIDTSHWCAIVGPTGNDPARHRQAKDRDLRIADLERTVAGLRGHVAALKRALVAVLTEEEP